MKSTLMLSPEDRTRVERVESLARSGLDGLTPLLGLLSDPSWAVRRAVVGALAAMGQPAVGPLTDILLHHRDNESRLAAVVDALVASSAPVDAAMVELVTGPHAPPIVCDGVQVLGRRRFREAVPLLSKLADHRDDNVAVGALEALGRIGGAETVEALVHAVSARNFFRTFPAIDALGRTGDVRAVRSLAALIGDPLYTPEAIRALGRTGQVSAVAALAPMLVNPSDTLVRAAASALADLRERHDARFGASEAIIETLHESVDAPLTSSRVLHALVGVSGSELAGIVHVLGYLGDSVAIEKLVELTIENPPVGVAAQDALRRLGARATEQIAQALAGGSSLIRSRLLPLVRDHGGHLKEIVACLEDEDVEVRCRACDALSRIGDTAAVTSLFAVLGDSEPRAAQAATAAIHALGSLDTKRLALERGRSSDAAVRRASLRIIAYFGYPEGLEILLDAIGDQDDRVAEAALFGLAPYDDPRVATAIFEATHHASTRVRAAAARALGQLKPTESVIAALGKLLGADDAWVRYYACQALGKLRINDAADALVSALDDASGQVRVAAVEALAQLKVERAFASLLSAASSPDADLARAAILGLGIHRRPEAIPMLRTSMMSTEPATRLAALGALSSFATADIVPIIAFSTADPDPSVRTAALGYLSTRPVEEATRALLECLLVEDARPRALEALAVAADERVEHVLTALDGADADRAPLYAEALVRMRRPSAHAALAQALVSANVHARRAAASALVSIATPEARKVLATAGASDPDQDVRRICSAADASSAPR